MQILMFTKMFKNIGNLPLEQAADRMVEMGFDGADLTVREGGYVLPHEASEKMPWAIDLLKSKGLDVPLITTNITDANQEHAEEIFRTASECDVKYIKLGYWKYAGFGEIHRQIEETKRKIDGICLLAEKYGVTATIHTHAGAYMSGDPALVYMLIKDRNPELIGAYIDPGHLFVELGPSGWEMAIDLLASHIRLVAVKNYRWVKTTDEKTGEKRWRIKMLPLKNEIVLWPGVFDRLRQIGFDGCISLHSEYEDLNIQQLIEQTKEDLEYIRTVLKQTGLT